MKVGWNTETPPHESFFSSWGPYPVSLCLFLTFAILSCVCFLPFLSFWQMEAWSDPAHRLYLSHGQWELCVSFCSLRYNGIIWYSFLNRSTPLSLSLPFHTDLVLFYSYDICIWLRCYFSLVHLSFVLQMWQPGDCKCKYSIKPSIPSIDLSPILYIYNVNNLIRLFSRILSSLYFILDQ